MKSKDHKNMGSSAAAAPPDDDNTPLKDHSLSSLPTYSPLNMCTFYTSSQNPSLFLLSSRKANDWTRLSSSAVFIWQKMI